MAGDWIKVEKATPDKPEVGFIARACGVSQADAFLAWFRLWSYLDDQISDGSVRMWTPEDCDRIGRLPGLGNALSSDQGCGWITFHGSGATVTNWDRHNGQSAKKRCQTNRRVSHWRDRVTHP